MSRIIIMVLAVSSVIFSLVSCSPQGQGKGTQSKVEESAAIDINNEYCPVSGEKALSDMSYVYEGKRYRFCCAGCIASFKRDPQKYIKIIEEGKAPEVSGQEHMHSN